MGLPASTVDLGAVFDVGYLERQNAQMQEQARGALGAEVTEAEVLRILDTAISSQLVSNINTTSTSTKPASQKYAEKVIIAGLKYTGHPAQAFWSHNPLFNHLVRRHQLSSSSQRSHAAALSSYDPNSPSIRDVILSSSTLNSAREYIYATLASKFSKTLMIESEDIDPTTPLGAYGSDSLVAVELRNWIRREMEAGVILMDMLADNTLSNLTDKVLDKSALVERLK